MEFVDPTNDVAFRKIFGNENRKKSLISFLNAILELPGGKPIEEVEILNPYQLPEFYDGKTTIIDVKAKLKDGATFLVEMQVAKPVVFQKRIQYYVSQSYSGQIKKGEDYQKLSPIYFIGILGFTFGDNPHFLSRHHTVDIKTGGRIFDDISFHLIQLPKFNKSIDELENEMDRWCFFMKNATDWSMVPEDVQEEGLKQAWLEAERQKWTSKEWGEYIEAGIVRQDQIGIVEQAKIEGLTEGMEKGKAEGLTEGMEKGKAEGLTEGMERGKAEGLTEGMEKGKAEGLTEGMEKGKAEGLTEGMEKGKIEGELKSKREIAKNLKATGIDSETIAKTTGLSTEEIDRL